MTLDEAIQHCLDVAKAQEHIAKHYTPTDYYDEANNPSDCLQCAADHRQLARWLQELKMYRESNDWPNGCI